MAAAAWAPGGQPRVVFLFTITDEIYLRGLSEPVDPAHVDLACGPITGIELLTDPKRLAGLDLVIVDDV